MLILQAPDPVAFSVFGFSVYWYGIIMAAAILTAVLTANSLCNKIHFELKKDIILSLAPLLIIFGIIGARLYFCSLNSGYYFSHPLEILDIREGGLSIHGALIFGVLSLFVIGAMKNFQVLKLLDILACSTFLGQSVGRWGNYFNSEAYGLPVAAQNWGLFIPPSHRVTQYYDYTLFHPTFLYESILDLLGFGILFFFLKKFGKSRVGFTFSLYLVLYAVIRFFIEQIRVDSALNPGGVPIAQLVSIVMFFGGLIGVFFTLKR
ncbi:MAG: prolipoprotein diacylglyceryl transferase [Muribaculaceae bacterium]|nr:prolipoprotein diacylglyceryl transferase [Muribaculaceae bacterium]